MSPSMLNVTVSRAQDSFLVFGDMDAFSSAAKGTQMKTADSVSWEELNGGLIDRNLHTHA